MTISEVTWRAKPVLHAIEDVERIPKERYYDPEFYELENKHFWRHVWQMACRLEEIPKPGDYAEYVILDQSIIVVRTADMGVKAYHNACRHRGVKLVEGHGSTDGFTCSFHGWCYGLDGTNTFVYQPALFSDRVLDPAELALAPVRCDTWGGCAFINLDDDAPPLRDMIEPFASSHDANHVETLQMEWWMSAVVPVNWKLAMEAFMEGYHVMETHPQLNPPGATKEMLRQMNPALLTDGGARDNPLKSKTTAEVDTRTMVDLYIRYMDVLSVGMGGMVHRNDVNVAESIRDIDLPADPAEAKAAWQSALNDAVMAWHRSEGHDIPDLNALDRDGLRSRFCFPNFFLLPQFSSSSGYRFRPLGPESTLFELYSFTRFPQDQARERPMPPEPLPLDHPQWPPIPKQDFSNLPKQQQGLHADGFRSMRLAERREGMISHLHRIIDGYIAGVPAEAMIPAIQATNIMIDIPIADFDF